MDKEKIRKIKEKIADKKKLITNDEIIKANAKARIISYQHELEKLEEELKGEMMK